MVKNFLSITVLSIIISASANNVMARSFYDRDSDIRLDRIEKDLKDIRESRSVSVSNFSSTRVEELEQQNRKLRGEIEENRFRIDKLSKKIDILSNNENNSKYGDYNLKKHNLDPISNVGEKKDEFPIHFSSPKEHYNYAFTLMNKARYAEAGDAFYSFLKRYPGDPLVGNVYYWLGETYYVRGDFVNAADSFRQGFESMPKGRKAPDNLLKLSMSLERLNKIRESCVVLKQIIIKYPDAQAGLISKAREERRRMRCN